MPRYFFHRMDGGFDRDNDGTDLPNLAAARSEAVVYVGQSIRDRPDLVWSSGELSVEVTGEDGRIVTTIVVRAIDSSAGTIIAAAR